MKVDKENQNNKSKYDTDRLSKRSKLITGVGIFVFLFGYLLLAMVGKHPESALGFIASLTILAGIIIVPVGFITE